MAIIELKNIVKTFPSEKVGEGVHAVRDVSLAIEEGDIFGIIGFGSRAQSCTTKNGYDFPAFQPCKFCECV